MRLFRKRKHNYAACYKEYDFFWKTFCKISKEAALYEKIHQYLIDNYNRDFDIEGTIELTDDERQLLYKWFVKKTLFVLSSSNLYNLKAIEFSCSAIETTYDNRYYVTFTKVNV